KDQPQGWSVELPPDLQVLYGRGYGGYALSVLDENNRVSFSLPPATQPLIEIPETAAAVSYFQQRQGRAAFYGISLPVHRGRRTAIIQVAQDLENADVIVDDVVEQFVGRVAWVLLPMFALLLVLDVLIVRRAL